MNKILFILFISFFVSPYLSAQDYGDLPLLKKESLLRDLDLLYQGLDQFHSGMYWYTPKDSIQEAFDIVRTAIDKDLNVLEFHKLIAPLVALTREDHTDIFIPTSVREQLRKEAHFMPLTFVFLGRRLFCVKNASDLDDSVLEGMEIETINGETPEEIVNKIGGLFASDGYIKTVKYSDLEGFRFSNYYYYYYGELDQFDIKFKELDQTLYMKSLDLESINKHLAKRYERPTQSVKKDVLEYEVFQDSIAYLGIHTFSNSTIKEASKEKNLEKFLKSSFKSIHENNIPALIIDLSENGGGTEGNAGLLYAHLGDNFKKYKKVSAKRQKLFLDNGTDKAIKLKTFGFFERVFSNKKMKDGSYERKQGIGHGLMAYTKEPRSKFDGRIYIIIGPETYSGASEFSNIMYSKRLASFVGQETGGGYLGNTSGYIRELILPNSKIQIDIPVLQFVMNVEPALPPGRGVIPHYEVIPTFEQYMNKENASLKYILDILEKSKRAKLN